MHLIDGLVETEALGDLVIRRIAQHRVGAADQNRHVRSRHPESLQQFLRACVVLQIDAGEWMAVANEELLDPKRAGAVARPDHDDVAEAVGNEFGATEDESPHDDVAELGVGLHQAQKVLAADLQDLAGLADKRAEQRRPTSDCVALANELTGPVRHDRRLGNAGRPQDLHGAGDHDEERDAGITDLDQAFAHVGRSASSVRQEAPDLPCRQDREELIGRRRAVQGHVGVRHDSVPVVGRTPTEDLHSRHGHPAIGEFRKLREPVLHVRHACCALRSPRASQISRRTRSAQARHDPPAGNRPGSWDHCARAPPAAASPRAVRLFAGLGSHFSDDGVGASRDVGVADANGLLSPRRPCGRHRHRSNHGNKNQSGRM